MLAAGVAGGAFGVVTYVSADRPSPADDRRALEAALLAPSELGDRAAQRPCASVVRRSNDRPACPPSGVRPRLVSSEEAALLDEHGTAQVLHEIVGRDRTGVFTYLAAFDTPVAAQNHRDLVDAEVARPPACSARTAPAASWAAGGSRSS